MCDKNFTHKQVREVCDAIGCASQLSKMMKFICMCALFLWISHRFLRSFDGCFYLVDCSQTRDYRNVAKTLLCEKSQFFTGVCESRSLEAMMRVLRLDMRKGVA